MVDLRDREGSSEEHLQKQNKTINLIDFPMKKSHKISVEFFLSLGGGTRRAAHVSTRHSTLFPVREKGMRLWDICFNS